MITKDKIHWTDQVDLEKLLRKVRIQGRKEREAEIMKIIKRYRDNCCMEKDCKWHCIEFRAELNDMIKQIKDVKR